MESRRKRRKISLHSKSFRLPRLSWMRYMGNWNRSDKITEECSHPNLLPCMTLSGCGLDAFATTSRWWKLSFPAAPQAPANCSAPALRLSRPASRSTIDLEAGQFWCTRLCTVVCGRARTRMNRIHMYGARRIVRQHAPLRGSTGGCRPRASERAGAAARATVTWKPAQVRWITHRTHPIWRNGSLFWKRRQPHRGR